MPHRDSSDLKDALLRRAFGADAEDLTPEETSALASMLHPRLDPQLRDDGSQSSEISELQRTSERSNRRYLLAAGFGAAGVACGLVIGAALNLSAPPQSPYLTNSELRSKLPPTAPAGDLGGIDAVPPVDADADPHSMVLNGVIEGNPAWTWTRQEGMVICYRVDLTADVQISGCADRTYPLTSLMQRSEDPSLTDPGDLGTYTVTAFEDALPFISYTALR